MLHRTLEEAASVPVVYATAYYALVVRGGMKKGESILIHSGSGGVGQAAIAIALSMGCRVFATVGEYRGSNVIWRKKKHEKQIERKLCMHVLHTKIHICVLPWYALL